MELRLWKTWKRYVYCVVSGRIRFRVKLHALGGHKGTVGEPCIPLGMRRIPLGMRRIPRGMQGYAGGYAGVCREYRSLP